MAIERTYAITERAHFMCPNMHYGIAFDMTAQYDHEKVLSAVECLAKAHPFLCCTMALDESGLLYYDNKGASLVSVVVGECAEDMWKDYRAVSQKAWPVFSKGLLKVFVYPQNNGFKLLFVAHHLLCDGRALLQLVCEFADCYSEGKAPDFVQESLIKSINDFPPKSRLGGVSRMLVNYANKLWKKENRSVSYEEYSAFAESFAKENPVCHEVWEKEVEETACIVELCRKDGFSVNDYLLAKLFSATNAEKIIIGADVRNDIACYRKGSLGNFASAVSVEYKSKDEDIVSNAKKLHRIVEKISLDKSKWMLILACYLDLEPKLIDAAAISSLGGFGSKAASFVGDTFLGFSKGNGISLTNLGAVQNSNIGSAAFMPPISPSAKAVFGVLTMNGVMKIACSFYSAKLSAQDLYRMTEIAKDS